MEHNVDPNFIVTIENGVATEVGTASSCDMRYTEITMKKKNCLFKNSVVFFLSLVLYSLPSYAGQWKNDGNWHYIDDNGNYLRNQWVGNYYLGSDGVMMTNSWTPDGYYVGADGAWNGQPALPTDYNYQTNTQFNSNSYMTLPGWYTAMTHLSRFDIDNDNAYIHDIEIKGDTLTLKGTLDYVEDYSNSYLPGRLQEGVYNFQLYSGTEYGEQEDVWKPISKAEFEQLVARGCGPCINVEVENGMVSSVSFSA